MDYKNKKNKVINTIVIIQIILYSSPSSYEMSSKVNGKEDKYYHHYYQPTFQRLVEASGEFGW